MTKWEALEPPLGAGHLSPGTKGARSFLLVFEGFWELIWSWQTPPPGGGLVTGWSIRTELLTEKNEKWAERQRESTIFSDEKMF